MRSTRSRSERLTDPARDFRALAQGADTSGLTAVARWTHATPDGPAWTWREAKMTLPEPMLPGAYLLVGRAAGLERRAVLFVTDLSLLVKRSPTQVLVSAASLKSGAPVAGARVFVVPATDPLPPGEKWSEALRPPAGPPLVTDERGLLRLQPASGGKRLRVVAVSGSHGVSVADALLAPEAERGGDQLFLYTDRPIYRPGQTLYWKAFARRAEGAGYAIPAPIGVVVTLSGPDGATLDVPAVKLSERGSADGAVTLPAEVAARRVDAGRDRGARARRGDGGGAGVPQARVPRRGHARPRDLRERRRGALPGRRDLLLRRAGVRRARALQPVRVAHRDGRSRTGGARTAGRSRPTAACSRAARRAPTRTAAWRCRSRRPAPPTTGA